MSDQAANFEVLIQIREELAGLRRTQQTIRETKQEADGLGKAIRDGLGIGTGMALATAAVALLKNTLIGSAREVFRFAGEIKDQSEALEMSARAYQVLRLELIAGAVDAGRLTMAISTQTQTLADARDAGSSAATAYRVLGLDLAALEQMAPDERLLATVRATQSATDKTMAYAAASQILGARGLRQLLSALRSVATDGFDKVALSAERSGQIMDQDVSDRLDKVAKRWERFKNWTIIQGASFLDALTSPMDNSVGAILERDRQRAAAGASGPTRTPPTPLALAQTVAWRQQELALMRAENDVAVTQAAAWLTDEQRRERLVKVMGKQIDAQAALLKLLKDTPLTPSENPADRERAIAEAEAKLRLLRENRLTEKLGPKPRVLQATEDYRNINNPDRPGYMAAGQGALTGIREFMVSLGSTGEQVASLLNNTLGQTIGSLTNDIWEAMKGTQGWGDAFRNVGNIAGRMLVQMIVQMTIVKSLQAALGWFSGLGGGASENAGFGWGMGGAGAGAGGGTFVTNGPAQLTVGDNPGGIEMVHVIPISGKGRSWASGSLAHFAGGGTLLAGGGLTKGGGSSTPVNVTFSFATGLSSAIRAEVMAMAPELRSLAVDAVREAHGRSQLRFA